ncbi:MAG: acetyltransferase component of pyruvate dehydrogenase complex [Candidatus Roseilinea sp.]|nr:MAG: acetyltransferase component of pyruvate dehydrogenase complex [Candidatus Roseilinea sp.]
MPSLGQTTDELRITAWLKAEGDAIALAEPILEVETDKAVLQVESSYAGTLLKILHHAGEVVPAGEPIAVIGQAGEAIALDSVSPTQPIDAAQQPNPPAVPATAGSDQVLATPIARKMAKELGLDLRAIQGSGPGGRIERRDVEAWVAANAATPAKHNIVRDDGAGHGAVPRHRQIIAQRLTRSVQTIPQITLNMTVDARAARSLVAARRAAGLAGLTVTHLLLQAVARALRAQPLMNRVWQPDGPTFRRLARTDVGLAVASDDNLLVVTLPEPDRLDLAALVRVADEAIQRARKGALSQADVAPTAITISNLGMYHVDSFQAIVDPDQSMILAVGRIADQIVAIEGGIYIVPQMTLSLSVDHRVADGAAAAKFLKAICDDLERINA